MSGVFYLIPLSLGLGAVGLGLFLWSLRAGQYEDLDGAAERILFEGDDIPPHHPLPPGSTPQSRA
ncbi:cbb3-type cytochrome oxidase assembly protein CcoS [Limobrevibacterium gyesilva]|uniref:Cbb3-type cytochrome oxidase assembly protein CcoS n=1 Tax=Limobrevibacterium gyesilva TaxID=2991712 RepID=A0AA41YH69_9PROT|nr:cbb3-type cytochrome oxidase assembly protein CcoS [Limobrevibacterium gyesilva]MCW3473181.1 cbb3-type cytochrome oxidase assembly protein CcoS [Limobrevibacterium gyesilva]